MKKSRISPEQHSVNTDSALSSPIKINQGHREFHANKMDWIKTQDRRIAHKK